MGEQIKTGDIVELVVDEKGSQRAAMYDGYKAKVERLQGDDAFVNSDGAGVRQSVSFKTWWSVSQLRKAGGEEGEEFYQVKHRSD